MKMTKPFLFTMLVAVLAMFGTAAAQAAAPIVQFDASTLALLNGDVVSAWGAQTAAGTPTYLTGQTPNGGPAVQFNGGGDRMGEDIFLSPSAAQDWIVVAVVRPDNIGAYHNLVDDNVQNRPMLWIDPAFTYELNFSGGTGARGAGTGASGWDVVIADSRLNQLYVNSPTPNASGREPVPFAAGETFDFFHRDGNQTFRGLVAELRIYNDRAGFGGDFASLYNEMYAKWIAPVVACVGFDPPMANYPVKVRGKRALPLKARLFDGDGLEVTDLDLSAPPVVQVLYDSGNGNGVDVSDDALPVGLGDDGNQLVYTGEGKWQYNLKTTNYTAAGTYTVFMDSGDATEYAIDPTCVTEFVIE